MADAPDAYGTDRARIHAREDSSAASNTDEVSGAAGGAADAARAANLGSRASHASETAGSTLNVDVNVNVDVSGASAAALAAGATVAGAAVAGGVYVASHADEAAEVAASAATHVATAGRSAYGAAVAAAPGAYDAAASAGSAAAGAVASAGSAAYGAAVAAAPGAYDAAAAAGSAAYGTAVAAGHTAAAAGQTAYNAAVAAAPGAYDAAASAGQAVYGAAAAGAGVAAAGASAAVRGAAPYAGQAASAVGAAGGYAAAFASGAIADAGEGLARVRAAGLAGASRAAQVISGVAPHVKDAAMAAGTAALGAAGDVADVASDAARAVASAAMAAVNSDTTRAALVSAEQFLAQAGNAVGSAAGAAGSMAWSAVGDLYDLSREHLATALAAAAGVALSIWDLVKIEIIRDVYQTLSLFFANISSAAMEQAKVVWGNVSGVVSFNFEFVVPSISPVVIYAILGILAFLIVLSFIWMLCMASALQPDEVRMGHENKSWAVRAEENKRSVKAINWILTAALSAYLPVSRSVVQVLVCDGTMGRVLEKVGANLGCVEEGSGAFQRYNCDCASWDGYAGLQVAAVILVIFYVVLLPVYCFWLIYRSIPYGSREDPNKRYNDDGTLVEYTNAMYQHDLQNDPRQVYCPYLFLYQGFERNWAYYKVIVMIFKLALIVPIIILWKSPLIQTLVTLGILLVFAVFSFLSSPFISPQADVMDSSGRITAFVTVLFGLIATDSVAPSSSDTMGILINIANAINFVVIVLFFLYSLPAVRRFIKNCTGQFTFSDTSKDISGRFDRIVHEWDVIKECKYRIWHPFWESLLLNKEQFGAEVPRRFVEQTRVAAEVGKHRIVAHFQAMGNPVQRAWQDWVQENLEGQDVFWDGVSFDGKLDSATRFGKMYVQPYPFCCVMVYDDGGDHTYIYGASPEFHQFVGKNQEPEIVRRRGVRQRLRALVGQRVQYTFQKTVQKTVADGTERDKDGNTKTRYSTISVVLTFHSGILNIGHNTSNRMADGFAVSIRFDDGAGSGVAPHTGTVHHFSNEVYVMGAGEIGIGSDFRVEGRFAEIMNHPANAATANARLPGVLQEAADYRREMVTARVAQERVLSSAFWLHVFDSFALPRPALEWYLANYETNPKLREIPTAHTAGLDFLYARVGFVTLHPTAAFWFVFFEDLWQQNKDMSILEDKAPLLDPRYPTALCYRPMPRDKLEALLTEQGLRASRKYVTDAMIDFLYAELTRRSSVVNPLSNVPAANTSV